MKIDLHANISITPTEGMGDRLDIERFAYNYVASKVWMDHMQETVNHALAVAVDRSACPRKSDMAQFARDHARSFKAMFASRGLCQLILGVEVPMTGPEVEMVGTIPTDEGSVEVFAYDLPLGGLLCLNHGWQTNPKTIVTMTSTMDRVVATADMSGDWELSPDDIVFLY